ncbi:MAG: protein-disulfide reductase DsbD [Pseudomonadota bacterium]
MLKVRQVFVLLMLLISTSGFTDTLKTPDATEITWQTYSDTPFSDAKKTKHYIFLYGKSKSCHWCQQMDKTTMHSPEIIKQVVDNFIPVLVDVDDRLDLAAKYHISSLPTILILDGDNHIVRIFSGYFTAEFMQTNLKKIIDHSADSANPEANVKEPVPAITNELLSKTIEDELKNQQYLQYGRLLDKTADPEIISANLTMDSIKYALISAEEQVKLSQQWVKTILDYQFKLFDPVWGGVYNTNGDFSKSTMSQAKALQMYTDAFRYWPDPVYISNAKILLNYVNNYLTSPESLFYAGQKAYQGADAANYYHLDDIHRRQLGMPEIDKRISPNENGAMITAMATYYMATGDVDILNKAIKAATLMATNFSIPGGGFRHEINDNNKIYLNDTVSMGVAYLTLYKATQNITYLNRAVATTEFINTYFKNSSGNSGFISSIELTNTSSSDLTLSAEENAEVIRLTSLLYNYTGNKTVQEIQFSSFRSLINPDILKITPPALILMSVYRVTSTPIHIVIVGPKASPITRILFLTALAYSPVNSRIDLWDKSDGPMMNAATQYQVMDKPVVYVCHGFQCSFPIYTAPDFINKLQELTTPEMNKGQQVIAGKLQNPDSLTSNNLTDAEILLKKGNWFFLILGFLGFGLLISFTPCILPLVPIMASIIVGNTIGVSKRKTFLLCLTYILAMASMYSLLGLLASKFGIYLQVYMQGKVIVIMFSLIFLVLAVCMLDDYELTLPKIIQNKINKWSNLQTGGTYLGVMIMGILSILIVSPCVSAPLLGVLSFITKTGDLLLGAVGLFFMGIGMGVPLLIITLFSKNILPKAAHWNNQIKHFFGLILLGTAIWLVSRVISEVVTIIFWSAFIILTTLYMGIFKVNVINFFNKIAKTLAIMLFIFGIALFLNALFINTDLYRTIESLSTERSINTNLSLTPVFRNIKNKADLQFALNEAKQTHLPVLLDFTAKWCSACVKLDHDILTNSAVAPTMNRFMLLRIDLTMVDSESMALAHQFHVFGPPMILLISEQGKLVTLNLTDAMTVAQFKAALEQVVGAANDSGDCQLAKP